MAIGAKATTQYKKLRLGIEVVDAKATVAYTLPVALVQYVQLNVSASLDVLNRNPFIADSTVVLDSKVIAFGKALQDSISQADVARKVTSKPFFDGVSLSDLFARFVAYRRTFADSVSTSDAQVIDFIKGLADSILAQEAITSKDYSKLLGDGVAINDEADMHDGFIVVFTKYFNNVVFAGDASTIEFDKAVLEEVVASDATTFEFMSALSDTVSFTDSILFSRLLDLFDTFTLDDTVAKTAGKLLTDDFEFTDAATRDVGKSLADAQSLSDDITRSFSKALADVLTLDDAKAIVFTRAPFADSASAADLAALTPGKGLGDTSTVDDTGSLLAQGYCDITYFAEDYVGEARSFT